MKKKNNNKMKTGRRLAGLASLALLAGIGTSCSSGMDDEAMTRNGAPMTVTATMQGVAKPAAVVSEVVSGGGTALPGTRTTTADDATAGVYTVAWQKGDVVNVVFHCYSDADGATEIDAALMSNGNTQTLTYDGTTWTALPASLHLPAGVYSVKAIYAYSRSYSAAGDTPIDATTIRTTMNRGTEHITGQSFIIAPDDITKTGIAIAPAADKWQRLTALVRLTSLAFGQSVRVTTAGGGVSNLISCPTMQTADPTQPANGVLTATVYLHQSVDDPANPAAVTSVAVDGVNRAVKPAFHTEAGRLYSIYVPLLFGELGPGDEDGGQGQLYDTWSGTYAQFYNNGSGDPNINNNTNWIIDLSAVSESDKATAVAFIKGKADARTTTVNITLTSIGTLLEDAFRNCTQLASISLPVATSIGNTVFSGCTKLTSVNLPTATSIGNRVFYSCPLLTSVNLPVATSVGDGAFNSCKALISVNLPVVKSIGADAFYSCSLLTSVDLPVATSIGGGAFNGCSSLTSVNLPVATSIGFGTFSGCSKLTSVSLPTVIGIGDYAFSGCSLLTSVSLPAATGIGYYVFSNAPLTTLKLTAAGAMTIDASAFANSGSCTLTLNVDKKPGGSGTPLANNNAWGNKIWKEILYE